MEPRVYPRDGFVVTLWTHYEAMPAQEIAPSEYSLALERLHAGMRQVDVTVAPDRQRAAHHARKSRSTGAAA